MVLKEVAAITQSQTKEMRKLQRKLRKKALIGLQQAKKHYWQKKHRSIRKKLLK